MSFFDDYAFVADLSFEFGMVHRISIAGSHDAKDYKRLVPYSHVNKDKLTVTMFMYDTICDKNSGITFLKLLGSNTRIKFTSIFSHVNLIYKNGFYSVSMYELQMMKEGAD